MCFQYCQFLFQLLHVLPCTSSVTIETRTQLEVEEQLNAIEQLLKIAIEKDVYNMAADHVSGDKQLSWYRLFTRWLNAVEVGKRSTVWFKIQCHLLELNYAIIEPDLKTFLHVTWLHVGQVCAL